MVFIFLLWLGNVFKHSIMTWFSLLTSTGVGPNVVLSHLSLSTQLKEGVNVFTVHNALMSWCTGVCTGMWDESRC